MITVYYNNDTDQGCVIRPTPLVSISSSPIRNGTAYLGSTYTITLTGTIINQEGSPIYTGGSFGPQGMFEQIGPNWDDNTGAQRPASANVPYGERLDSMFKKQNAIRELFAQDGQKMEISPITNNGAVIVCYPEVESINFEEGIYVDICRYTVVLRASALLDDQGRVLEDGKQRLTHSSPSGVGGGVANNVYSDAGRITELDILSKQGGFVSDVNDVWTLEPDESLGTTTSDGKFTTSGFRLTRSMNATGITKYIGEFSGGDSAEPKRYEAWEMARNYIKKVLLDEGNNAAQAASGDDYPYYNAINMYASGFLDLKGFTGYGHARTENIDQGGGTYEVTDTWLLASGDPGSLAFEQYDMKINSSRDNAYVEVSIDGSIRGVNTASMSDQATDDTKGNDALNRALEKYYLVSNSGQYGINSEIYKRCNAAVSPVLNAQPKVVSLGQSPFGGEVSYSVSFDNRPTNYFTGVMSESIQINDTYPGDVFTSIAVLGRATGPILQYMDTRTEYKRDITIEIQLDYTDIGYGSNRNNLLMTKPSINQPISSELNNLIAQLSPANEPGIVKYFISPPSENWNPRTGVYSISISWTYELDK